ncbi:Serine palmitoyltransferase 2 [Sarcoptes scabiei]|uniref:serine C-palmitoyltransferase n=1 Tax=Sarcoptes scabiei TaxID=52283 RepID=A0A834VBN7_SARSC|nr:Serine palmitoyltransferase 2 [Sarcoptes scabiei]
MGPELSIASNPDQDNFCSGIDCLPAVMVAQAHSGEGNLKQKLRHSSTSELNGHSNNSNFKCYFKNDSSQAKNFYSKLWNKEVVKTVEHHKSSKSKRKKEKPKFKPHNHYEEPPYHIALLSSTEKNRQGYTPLYKNFHCFYTRNIYRRIRDAWNRPISSVPGGYIEVIDRQSSDENWSFYYSGIKDRVINMGSYNYLGYAENSGPITEKVIKIIKENGVGVCSSRNELGHSKLTDNLEKLMARFLGVEDCVVFGMGFATNSTNIQCFVNQNCLILSDEHNHASLILGCRLSGATTKIFKHNDMEDLEMKIRRYIIEGQPKTGESWAKIIVVVEGIYSMEGTIVDLPKLIELKRKYNCYIYLDEAHSIGALGPNGKGVVDYFGCDPNDIDILMGTFTKSFGAAGGYVAGKKIIADTIRIGSYSHYYATSMSPPIAQQIISVLKSLLGEDGTQEGANRIKRLAQNSRYFRRKLIKMGFIVYGHDDSPVVPLLLCFCSKIAALIRMAHEKGLGLIGAGYPATALTTGRARFCISASHTKEMLDHALAVIEEIGTKIGIKYSRQNFNEYEDYEELDQNL